MGTIFSIIQYANIIIVPLIATAFLNLFETTIQVYTAKAPIIGISNLLTPYCLAYIKYKLN